MTTLNKNILISSLLLLGITAHAGTMGMADSNFSLDAFKMDRLINDTTWALHIGGFFSHQGIEQHVNLNGVLGNEYEPTHKNSGNVIVGVGFLRPLTTYQTINLEYGLHLYYLPTTTTSGQIQIENVLPNLNYKYSTTSLPLYANLKLNVDTAYEKTKFTVDFGLGPNFMTLTHYREQPRTAATIPNAFYSRQTKTELATLLGVGLRSTHFDHTSLELGYRFLYLGNSSFSPNNSNVLSPLKTGPVYANAITLSAYA